jgi:hypothetical protein
MRKFVEKALSGSFCASGRYACDFLVQGEFVGDWFGS